MSGTYGLTPTGLVIERFADIVNDFNAFYQSLYGNPNLDPTSVIGRRIAAQAQQLTQIWELIQLVYNAPFIAVTDEGSIDNTLFNEGITRKAALPTVLNTVQCVFSKAATIPAGSLISDSKGDQFAAIADIVAGGSGIVTGLSFQCTTTGSIIVPGNDTLSIVTPIDGWTSVNFPSGNTATTSVGTVGRDIETLAEARLRYVNSVAINGAGTIPALYANLNNIVDFPDVTASIIENDTDITDIVTLLPPHSISVIVNGIGSTAEKNAIAAVIWTKRGGGIQLYASGTGAQSVTIIDSNGDPQVVKFSYVTNLNVTAVVGYSLFTEETPPSDIHSSITAAVQAVFDATKPGKDLLYGRVIGAIYTVPGIESVTLTLNGGTTDISVSIDKKAVLVTPITWA